MTQSYTVKNDYSKHLAQKHQDLKLRIRKAQKKKYARLEDISRLKRQKLWIKDIRAQIKEGANQN